MPEQAPTGNLQERRDYKNYVILGVGEGGGALGMHDASIYERYPSVKVKVDKGARYVSIEALQQGDNWNFEKRDVVEKRYQEIMGKWRGKPGLPDRVFTEGDANDFIFPDASVNEVWFENVFGDKTSNLDVGAVNELARILVDGGEAFVFEEYTPDIKRNFFEEIKRIHPEFDVEIFTGKKLEEYLVSEHGFSQAIAKKRAGEEDGIFSNYLAVLKRCKR